MRGGRRGGRPARGGARCGGGEDGGRKDVRWEDWRGLLRICPRPITSLRHITSRNSHYFRPFFRFSELNISFPPWNLRRCRPCAWQDVAISHYTPFVLVAPLLCSPEALVRVDLVVADCPRHSACTRHSSCISASQLRAPCKHHGSKLHPCRP